MAYTKTFELSIDDIDLIETALRNTQRQLSDMHLHRDDDAAVDAETPSPDEVQISLRKTHDLLGRLHNQKVFYRPKSVYVGG